ncbi:MAG TPA: nucleotidyltransferase family protein, partial [Candidatus Competibacteraceae bacterium]|nr:nucleotidyltransferase family protein [Candidatus Competibacteraceae bacterium]
MPAACPRERPLIVGVLLAAGSATRFGADKLVQSLPDGTPLAVAAGRALLAGVDRGVVVVRSADAPPARLLAELGFQVVIAAEAQRGMGHSLAAGVAASADAAGWLIALADMPLVRPQTVAALAERLRQGSALVAPVYGGRRGHPVGFGRAYRERLLRCHGDQGARQLLTRDAARLQLLAVDDPGVLQD